MSGGGGTTVQQQSLPDWIQPYATSFLDRGGAVADRPLQQYTGQRVAPLTDGQVSNIQGINNLAGGTPLIGQADQMLGETLSGQGFDPFLQQVSDRVANDAGKAYQANTGAITARFNTPGNWGGSAHMGAQDKANESFARGLGDAMGPIYSGAYDSERNRQMQAATQAPSLYDTLEKGYQGALAANAPVQEQQQKQADLGYQQFQEQKNYPEHQLDVYGNVVNSLLGKGGNSKTDGPGTDYGAMAAQGASSAALMYLMYTLMAA